MKPGESELPPRAPIMGASLGLPDGSFQMHRHDGTPAGGGLLQGPYYLTDEITQRRYRIAVRNGVLTPVEIG